MRRKMLEKGTIIEVVLRVQATPKLLRSSRHSLMASEATPLFVRKWPRMRRCHVRSLSISRRRPLRRNFICANHSAVIYEEKIHFGSDLETEKQLGDYIRRKDNSIPAGDEANTRVVESCDVWKMSCFAVVCDSVAIYTGGRRAVQSMFLVGFF